MNLGDTHSNGYYATLILNASPDANLLNRRAKILNGAGYYTSSAHSAEEAVQLAVGMDCALALICYSFADPERQTISEQLRKLSPRTNIVCVEPELDTHHRVLLAKVEETLAK